MIRFLSKHLINRYMFWIYFSAILLLVSLPISHAGVTDLNNITIIRIRGDYFFHVLAFLPWAFFLPIFSFSKPTWLLLGIIFAVGSESLQYLLPYRAFNINDLLANTIGIAIGMAIFLKTDKYIRK